MSRLVWHIKHEDHFFRWGVSRFLFYSRVGSLLTFRCGSYKLHFFASNLSLLKWLEPSFGSDDEEVLKSLLRPGDTMIDVGSNIGTLTLTAARAVGPSGRVIGFEPDPRIFRFLKKNVKLNRLTNISLHNCACGENSGKVRFTRLKTDDQNRVDEKGTRVVDMIMLDEALRLHQGRIRLLKIDVEGHELGVIKGAEKVLSRTEFVYFEVSEELYGAYGYSLADILYLLRKLGFEICVNRGKAAFADPGRARSDRKCFNLLCKRTAD